jgi:hypothetical protein
MIVKELIEVLEKVDPDLVVVVDHHFGGVELASNIIETKIKKNPNYRYLSSYEEDQKKGSISAILINS